MRTIKGRARRRRSCWTGGAAVVLTLLQAPGIASASNWTTPLAAASHGQSTSGALPGTPTGISATCTSSTAQTVTVTWNAVPNATQYTVYDSSTSGGTYLSIGTSPTNTFTSGSLATGNYYFKVTAAYAGTNWASSKSSASVKRIIGSGSCS